MDEVEWRLTEGIASFPLWGGGGFLSVFRGAVLDTLQGVRHAIQLGERSVFLLCRPVCIRSAA